MQRSLAKSVLFDGIGLHTGAPVRMALCPAPAGQGIVFRRDDLGGRAVPARWDAVDPSPLMTRLVAQDGTSVATVEHVMAALAGTGVTNATVRLSGPEAPILDGSSAPFVRAIRRTGLTEQPGPLTAWRVLRPVEVQRGDAVARLEPGPGLEIGFEISFPDAAIGHQSRRLDLAGAAFCTELAEARTFCRAADIDAMHAAGRALGGSYDNAVVVDGARVLSPGGLRWPDEAVRHKMLDALGDLALAGAPILGRYTGLRAGHALTNALLHRLFAEPGAVRPVTCTAAMAARLPGLPAPHLRAVA